MSESLADVVHEAVRQVAERDAEVRALRAKVARVEALLCDPFSIPSSDVRAALGGRLATEETT